MKNIIFLGPPGSGKGTYSRKVAEALKMAHVSSGDLLRAARDDPQYGKEIIKHQDSGMPVPDAIVMPIVVKRLSKQDAKKGAVFDAMPYNLDQAKAMEKVVKTDLVINLVLPDKILIKKNLGRRTCSVCGDPSYNLVEINEEGIKMPALLPKVPGKCDKCGGKLVERTDDTEEIMLKRLKVYKERIAPVIEFYKGKKVLVDCTVNGSPATMVPKCLEIVKENL